MRIKGRRLSTAERQARKRRRDKAWRRANPGMMYTGSQLWRLINPERSAANPAKWRRANPEKMSAIGREWRQANPEKVLAQSRQHRLRYPEATRAYERKRRALRWGAAGSHTAKEWVVLRKRLGDRCLVCGTTERLACDHIWPLSLGGSNDLDNLQPLCRGCNSRKNTSIADYRLFARHGGLWHWLRS
jgi:5-methylcytosine-specific restriction endonuclease McrA